MAVEEALHAGLYIGEIPRRNDLETRGKMKMNAVPFWVRNRELDLEEQKIGDTRSPLERKEYKSD